MPPARSIVPIASAAISAGRAPGATASIEGLERSIIRRSGHRFGVENATKLKNLRLERPVGNPDIAVWIGDIAFSQAMRLVGRRRQDRIAVARRGSRGL